MVTRIPLRLSRRPLVSAIVVVAGDETATTTIESRRLIAAAGVSIWPV